jgi:hypothetical protein
VGKGVPPGKVGSNITKKVGDASMIGTGTEFYEFLIYGNASALVFAKVSILTRSAHPGPR